MAADLNHAGFKLGLPVDDTADASSWTAPELVKIKRGTPHHQRASEALKLPNRTIEGPSGKSR